MVELLEISVYYSIVTVTTVEAIKLRIPSIDGWKILILAGVISLILSFLFTQQSDFNTEYVIHSIRVAILTWIIAVGGDGWVSKIASKMSTKTNIINNDNTPNIFVSKNESPTKPDIKIIEK